MIFFLVLLLQAAALSSLHSVEERRDSPIFSYLSPIEGVATPSGLEPVDCLYVINLEERRERWARTYRACKLFGLNPSRFAAVNGWLLPKEALEELFFPHPPRLRGGEVGCLLSHLSILTDAKERGFDIIWVVEDDIEFLGDPQLLAAILSELESLDPDWDILYTDVDFRCPDGSYLLSTGSDFRPEGSPHDAKYFTERFILSEELMRIRGRFGTYSMIISKRGVEKILDYFRSRSLWTPIDVDIHYISGIREYSTRRNIVSNIPLSSSDCKVKPGFIKNPARAAGK